MDSAAVLTTEELMQETPAGKYSNYLLKIKFFFLNNKTYETKFI